MPKKKSLKGSLKKLFKGFVKKIRGKEVYFGAFLLLLAILFIPVPKFSSIEYEGEKYYAIKFSKPIILGFFQEKAEKSSNSIKMDVFIMSYCPFGRRFVLNALPKIVETYPDIDWDVYFIVSKQGEEFSSMHGERELEENMREACIIDIYGKETWLKFAQCFYSKNNFAECASQNGIDAQKIENCKDERGKELMEESYEKTQEMQAFASPTIVFNGGERRIEGAYPFEKFNQTIFELLTGESLPNPEVKLYIIVPKDCPSNICNYMGIVGALKSRLNMNLSYELLSPEDTNLDDLFEVKAYPAYVFDSSIDKSPAKSDLAPYLQSKEGYYLLRTRANVINAEEKPKTVELFVMSHCPFGNKAEEAMMEVIEALPDIDVEIYFIADYENGKFSSMHGEEEVNENLRQVCIIHHYPEKIWDYLACITKNYTKSAEIWKNCAESAGIDVNLIENCWEGEEGKELLRENIERAKTLGFSASPTFLINGKYIISGLRSAEELKQVICSVNKNLRGCEKELSKSTGLPSGAC